jgi:dihydrofolate reductase
MKKISIIVAIAENNAIGKDNQLLWHISEDLKRFKALTTGRTIIMGKKTFESLPIRPLPNRRSIVITDVENEIIEGCVMAYSINDAICKCDSNNENFVIGGGSIYNQFLSIADKLYITKVNASFEADTFFSEIDYNAFNLIEQIDVPSNANCNYSYSYLVYERK